MTTTFTTPIATTKLPGPHPLSKLFPPMSDEDFRQLKDDIKANGLQQPIVIYQDKILDGSNRARACYELGLEPCGGEPRDRLPIVVEFKGTEKEAEAYAISANIHRRHLSPEQRRKIIEKLIKADPSKSNRQIAETAKVSHVTVGDVRTELETTGQIDQLEKTTGADGKSRKRKGKPKGSGSGRMRAAIEALPFETPRVSAVAVGYLTGADFATRLERAVEASNRAKLIEGRVLPESE
jgi:ParB-like chromosome segregation protein Spo0J